MINKGLFKNKAQANYGKPVNSGKRRTVKTIVFSKQFDDGRTLNLPDNKYSYVEYDILGKGIETASPYSIQESNNLEYDIIYKEPGLNYSNPASKDLNLGPEAFVESFQEPGTPVSQPQSSLLTSKPHEPAGKAMEDDELIKDLKSILSGNKVYDQQSKAMVNTSALAGKKSPIRQTTGSPDKEEEEIKPLDKKDEHQIFEKIRQSMTYANAYDMGSVNIDERFMELEKLRELGEKSKKKEKVVKSVPKKTGNIQPEQTLSSVSSRDFIEDLDQMVKGRSTAQSSPIPLDPGIGGRSIGIEALQAGDIILSTTNEKASKLIRLATGSEISHSSVYIGDGKVIEAISDGVLERSLDTSLMDDTLAVAYRHVNMTPEKARPLVDFLKKASESKTKYDYWSLVRVAPYQIVNNHCSSLPSNLQDKCRQQARNFRTGTDLNNEFYCSELVLKALKEAGLSISDVDPSWSSPQDIVRLNHNGSLLYVGHLKV